MTTTTEQLQVKEILETFNDTRNKTLELVSPLEKDDFVVQTAFFMSPPKWHLGHVSWLFEIILNQLDKNYEFYSEEYLNYLNSYYNRFGVPYDKGRRGVVSRPTVDQILEYYDIITKKVQKFLQKNHLDEKASNLFKMGCNHECQHQELLVYDLQHLLADQYNPIKKTEPPKSKTVEPSMVKIKGGILQTGLCWF